MLIKLLIYTFIFFFQALDFLLSLIPGVSNLATYPQMVNSTLSSVYGTMHSILPDTFSTIAMYVNLMFGIWVAYFVLVTLKRFIPFMKPVH